MNQDYYKDKTEHDWRLKFTVDEYYDSPEYWSYEVELPKWAKELHEKGYKGICALDFYDELFNDDDIAPKVEGKKFIKGQYSPKILRIYPKPKDRWTPKEADKMLKWLIENQEGEQLENYYLETLKAYDELRATPYGKGVFGEYQSETDKKKELKFLEAMVFKAKYDLNEYRKSHRPKPNFILSKVDYIFQEKENLWDTISYSKKEDFLVIRPVSYAGRSMEIEKARFLHAMVIEIDGLIVKNGKSQGLNELIFTWNRTVATLPKPTYIVCSGSGVHLYFVFDRPIPLFANVMQELNEMRIWLVNKFWNSYVSDERVQVETLTQGFRVVGSYAKNHRAIVCAFEVGSKIDLEYLNSFVPENKRVTVIYKRKGLSLEDAKKAYPVWYQERIIEKQPKNTWTLKTPAMYYWWRQKILDEAKEGCRGYMLENLCSLALKCEIPEADLDRDLEMLLIEMEKRTESEDNHFTDADIERAKQTFIDKKYNGYARRTDYLRNKFEPLGIKIPETKRNYRKQNLHMKLISAQRDILYPDGTWREGNGRPSKQDVVKAWRIENPHGSKNACIRETGLDKKTVYKWWDT